MPLGQFRRSVTADTAKKGGKGSRGSWYEKLRLPQNTPTPFLLIQAEYVEPNPDPKTVEFDPATGQPKPVKNAYYKFRKHKRKLFLNGKEQYPDTVCSAGTDPHHPLPCAGEMAQDVGDKSVTTSDTFAIGLVHLHPYHSHPIVDRQTKQYKTKDDGSLMQGFDACEGRNCNFCRVLAGQQPVLKPGEQFPYYQKDIGTVFGRRRYLELGKNHLADLVAWDQQIGSVCGTIHSKDVMGNPQVCGQQLTTDGYVCPICKNTVIDMGSDPRSDEEIAKAVIDPYPCLHCQRPVLLEEVISCEKCDAMNEAYVKAGHPNPGFKATQHSLFDVVLWGCRQGENTSSHLFLNRFETVDAFTKSSGLTDQHLGGKTMQQIIEELGKPYDFAELFKPQSVDDQIKRLHLEDVVKSPMQAGGPSYGGSSYGPPQGQPPPNAPFIPNVGQPPATSGYVQSVGGPPPVVPQGAPAPTGYQPQPWPTQAGTPGPAPFVPPVQPNYGNKQ